MKNFIILLSVIICSSQTIICQNQQNYSFKSGIIKYKLEGHVNGIEIIYFDEYGNLFYDSKTIDNTIDGKKNKNTEIKILSFDTLKTLFPNSQTAFTHIITDSLFKTKWNIILPEMLKNMDFVKSGNESISGVSCEKYSGVNGKMWIWNNIVIKSEIEIMGSIIIKEAKEIRINLKIPKNKFIIPENYSLINK